MKGVNTLTRNLLMQKEDIGEFVEKVKEKVKSLCTKIRETEGENKYAKILMSQLSLLHIAYDEVKEVALGEFNKLLWRNLSASLIIQIEFITLF